MEMFVIVFFVFIAVGYVFESYYYDMQKNGKFARNSKQSVLFYNLVLVGLLVSVRLMVEHTGIDNFSTFDQITFSVANIFALGIVGGDGFLIGSYIRAQRRFLNNEPVPHHLLKSEEEVPKGKPFHVSICMG